MFQKMLYIIKKDITNMEENANKRAANKKKRRTKKSDNPKWLYLSTKRIETKQFVYQ